MFYLCFIYEKKISFLLTTFSFSPFFFFLFFYQHTVIECNLRASRTFPFVSKTFDFNFISLATKAMLGVPVKPHNISLLDLEYVGVKAPQFSFTRLQGADPTLGVEMSSTGEVACFGKTMNEAYLLALKATRFKMPTNTHNVLLSIGPSRGKFC